MFEKYIRILDIPTVRDCLHSIRVCIVGVNKRMRSVQCLNNQSQVQSGDFVVSFYISDLRQVLYDCLFRSV